MPVFLLTCCLPRLIFSHSESYIYVSSNCGQKLPVLLCFWCHTNLCFCVIVVHEQVRSYTVYALRFTNSTLSLAALCFLSRLWYVINVSLYTLGAEVCSQCGLVRYTTSSIVFSAKNTNWKNTEEMHSLYFWNQHRKPESFENKIMIYPFLRWEKYWLYVFTHCSEIFDGICFFSLWIVVS